MVWIYLAALEELPSPCTHTLNQSPTAKLSHTAKASSCKECKRGNCPKHQFGTTYERYEEAICQRSTSSQEASPARISVLQELERAWKESEADYFLRSCAWPKKRDPSSYSLKTCQPSQGEAVFASLAKLPRWGMIADGVLYPLQALEPYIDARGGSCWLTPSTMEHLPVRGNSTSRRKVSGRLNEQVAYPEMWPTPNQRDWKDTAKQGNRKSPNLGTKVLQLVATPTASQANKPTRAPSPTRENGSHGEDLRDSIGRLNPEFIGKKLSVAFVELMMAYPIGWTGLKPLETASFPSK